MDTTRAPSGRTIVVGADGSAGADTAVAWAAREAVTTGATLRIVNAWSVPTIMWPATVSVAYIDPADVRNGAMGILERARELAEQAVGSLRLDVEVVAVQGGAAEQLLARSEDAALLVVGTRGRGGFASLVLGSVATTCAHHTGVPLAIVGAGAPPPGSAEIVVGVDDSPGGRAALRWAAQEAGRVGSILRAVHAWEAPVAPGVEVLGVAWDPAFDDAVQHGFERLVAEEIDSNSDRPVVQVVAVLGAASDALLREAKGAGLLVVGSRGRGGFRELLLGSVGQHCLHHGDCPLVIVPTGR
ncbi:universal stress protein [soil metagenome]